MLVFRTREREKKLKREEAKMEWADLSMDRSIDREKDVEKEGRTDGRTDYGRVCMKKKRN